MRHDTLYYGACLIYMRHDTLYHGTCLVYVRHDTLYCGTCLIYMRHDTLYSGTCLIYMRQDTIYCGTCLIYTRHDTLYCGTCLIFMQYDTLYCGTCLVNQIRGLDDVSSLFRKKSCRNWAVFEKRQISNIHVPSYLEVLGAYRVAKTHRMPDLHMSFSAKEPYNIWLFCSKETNQL